MAIRNRYRHFIEITDMVNGKYRVECDCGEWIDVPTRSAAEVARASHYNKVRGVSSGRRNRRTG